MSLKDKIRLAYLEMRFKWTMYKIKRRWRKLIGRKKSIQFYGWQSLIFAILLTAILISESRMLTMALVLIFYLFFILIIWYLKEVDR